jgi:hypothetical protein
MDEKRPPRDPVAATPKPEDGIEPPDLEGEFQEAASPSEEGPDPYDDLWDPDMDMRPERIRRTKARPPRPKGPARGRRREEA